MKMILLLSILRWEIFIQIIIMLIVVIALDNFIKYHNEISYDVSQCANASYYIERIWVEEIQHMEHYL